MTTQQEHDDAFIREGMKGKTMHKIPCYIAWQPYGLRRAWQLQRLDTGDYVRGKVHPSFPIGIPRAFPTVAKASAWLEKSREYRLAEPEEMRAVLQGHAFECNKWDDPEGRYMCDCGVEPEGARDARGEPEAMTRNESNDAKVQHTPGPWAHSALAGDHEFAVYAEATGRDIALVRDFDEANARLIAAAPELLAACNRMLDASASTDASEWAEAVEQMEAAIARATEGQP